MTLLASIRERQGDALVAYELIARTCLDLVHAHVHGTRDPFGQRHPWYVLLDLAGSRGDGALRGDLESLLADSAGHGLVADAVISQTLAQGQDLWRLRESIPDAIRAAGPALRSDIAVAVDRIPRFIADATEAVLRSMPGLRIVCFGHVGDGNLHFNVLPPAATQARSDWSQPLYPLLYDIVAGLGGSFSAEHGVGQAKRAELARYKSDVELEMMRTLKRAFDPLNLMNPGKIL